MVNMTTREDAIEELLESIDTMLNIIEDQEVEDHDFILIHKVTEHLREEIDALQEK